MFALDATDKKGPRRTTATTGALATGTRAPAATPTPLRRKADSALDPNPANERQMTEPLY